jgi:hypothetical protein
MSTARAAAGRLEDRSARALVFLAAVLALCPTATRLAEHHETLVTIRLDDPSASGTDCLSYALDVLRGAATVRCIRTGYLISLLAGGLVCGVGVMLAVGVRGLRDLLGRTVLDQSRPLIPLIPLVVLQVVGWCLLLPVAVLIEVVIPALVPEVAIEVLLRMVAAA